MDRNETKLVDAKGRTLSLRGMSLVEQYRLAKAVGAETAKNDVAWSMAQTAAAVRDIDGVPLPYPTTDAQVEQNIERIGDEGYAAFISYLQNETTRMMEATRTAQGPLEVSAPSPVSQGYLTPST